MTAKSSGLAVAVGAAVAAGILLMARRKRKHATLAPLRYERASPNKMLANQSALPRWPLPDLDATLARYLQAVRHIVSDEEYATAAAAVQDALADGSEVRALHDQLRSYDESKVAPSFVSEQWNDMYFSGREGIAVHSTPGIRLRDDTFPAAATSQVQRAARMVAATLAFALEVESGTLPPDSFRATPLDMTQYTKIFGSCRIPRETRDAQYKASPADVGHIIVLRGGEFWRVPVVDQPSGRPLSVWMLERQLQHVVSHSAPPPQKGELPSLAVLTTERRAEWAAARRALIERCAGNAAAMRAVDDALIHVCLDHTTVRHDEPNACVRSYLHGDARGAPRWYDKSLTLMFSADEHAVPMAQFEHSCCDGMPAMRWFREMLTRVRDGRYSQDGAKPRLPERAPLPERLVWDVPRSVAALMEEAESRYDELARTVQVSCLRYTKWGAGQLKKWKCSPDGAVQQAFQLAFYKLNKRTPSTYESCSTAHYAGGRTETLRPVTGASKAFVRAVARGGAEAELAASLRAAAAAHADAGKDAGSGRGFDRHLFALKCAAHAKGGKLPELFEDASYRQLAANELSTTNMTDELTVETPWMFGPVHPQGVGIGYHLPPNELGFSVSTYSPQDAFAFTRELEAALDTIGRLLALGA